MAKGGARSNSGPPKDPNALRRPTAIADGEWTNLPAEGRVGDAPEWPLDGRTDREIELWAAEWRRPQAVMWERNGQFLEVALFVRAVGVSESPRATASDRTVVRQMMEALGVSLPGMKLHRWRIVDPDAQVVPTPSTPARRPARDRLALVKASGD